jgi:alkylhydroperoxidase/carboxymuconolactone decarboxylase family protein YurZ
MTDAGPERLRADDAAWTFRWEAPVHEAFPALHDAQAAWLATVDSLTAPDRRTHELIRMVCQVVLRNPAGIERHARLAAEVGATWDDVLGSIMLTAPAFGVLVATQALDPARAGYDAAAIVSDG